MKRLLSTGRVAAIVVAMAGVALAAEFSDSLRPQDFSSAGLAKLSPDELARLDTLVRDYKREAEARAAQAEDEARAAKIEAAEQRKAEASRMAQIKKVSPRAALEIEPIETRIKGKFTGWDGKAVFALENGDRWQVANSGTSYYTPAIDNPRVKIEPAAFGGFWMTIFDIDQRVRVKPLQAR